MKQAKKQTITMCYLQIFILVLSSFAFSYIVYQADSEIREANEQKLPENIEQGKTGIITILIKSWLSRSKFNLVSAQVTTTLQCCPKLKNNASCQEISSERCSQECSVPCLPTRCSETLSCKTGCCFDNREGICTINTPKQVCVDSRGNWTDDRNCNIEECRLGCCVLGRNTQFVTEKRCEKLSSFYNFQLDFKPSIDTEIGCLALSYQQDEGACIIETESSGTIKKNCKFTTKQDCLRLNNNPSNFFKNKLCSLRELNTTCLRQSTTGCKEGRDEVYWFDSCGNQENIYSSDKDKSWNNGTILLKNDSCNPSSGNANSQSCGNCNYFLGSICGKSQAQNFTPTFGKYICKDLNCKNAPAHANQVQDRKNGESWCVYDGRIGNGKDVPGSRHFKYYCIDGEVKVDACQDFRNGLCVETQDNSTRFSIASCRPNRALECISYNSEGGNEECAKNSDCKILNMDFGNPYKFSVCAANYPQGFNLKDNSKASQQLCSQASLKCTKVLVDGECKAGCDCDTTKFTTQMNEWCSSIGDCGLKVNIAGKEYRGYDGNAPGIGVEDNSKAKAGEYAEPGNDTLEKLAAYYGWGAGSVGEYTPEKKKEEGIDASFAIKAILGSAAGAAGVYVVGMATPAAVSAAGGGLAFFTGGAPGSAAAVSAAGGTAAPASAATLSGFGSAMGAAGIGAAVGIVGGMIATKVFGLTGWQAAAVGGILGGGLGGLAVCFFDVTGICAVAIIVGLIVGALTGYFGGKKKPKIEYIPVEFKCMPWHAPNGGADCGKCNSEFAKDGKKCSKYRCSSLGQTCEFINEGTGRELCVDINPDDILPPTIKPWLGFISPNYKYTEITDNSFKILRQDNECLTEFNPVLFGITNNEPSQCKIDTIHKTKYEDMSNYFGDSNLYEYNHSMALNMPSVESLIMQLNESYWLNQTEIEQIKTIMTNSYGNITFFVRCKDKKGNTNANEYFIQTCVKPGPDLTPPAIMRTQPTSPFYLAFNQTQASLKIWVNEPANCRYSYNNIGYELMNSTFNCLNDIQDAELYGWPCYSNLTALVNAENNVYIRCKDQPWLPETNTSRNTMQQSHVFTIKSSSVLNITRIIPNGTIKVGTEPASATLTAYTSGGAENGKAICEYSFTNSNFIQFFNTFSSVHTQVFNMLLAGNYNIYVKCQDIAGNMARGTTNLNVEIDRQAPIITRIYKSGGLKVITDEDAECVYSFKTCYFNWENATRMSGIQKEHTANIESGKTYYIKCKDIWNNKPDECSIIIKPE